MGVRGGCSLGTVCLSGSAHHPRRPGCPLPPPASPQPQPQRPGGRHLSKRPWRGMGWGGPWHHTSASWRPGLPPSQLSGPRDPFPAAPEPRPCSPFCSPPSSVRKSGKMPSSLEVPQFCSSAISSPPRATQCHPLAQTTSGRALRNQRVWEKVDFLEQKRQVSGWDGKSRWKGGLQRRQHVENGDPLRVGRQLSSLRFFVSGASVCSQ